MKKPGFKDSVATETPGAGQLPVYVPPKIVTYTSEELLERVGPALTCSGTPCGIPSGSSSSRAPKY